MGAEKDERLFHPRQGGQFYMERVEDKRQAILDATLRLIAEKGEIK